MIPQKKGTKATKGTHDRGKCSLVPFVPFISGCARLGPESKNDSASINAISFSSVCTMKRLPLSRCASTIQIVRPLKSIANRNRAGSRLLFLAEFLEARIIPERIEHRIEPEQRRSERQVSCN